MSAYEIQCSNRDAFCPQAATDGPRVQAHANTREQAQEKAPECRTCGVKMRVVAKLDGRVEQLAVIRRAG